MLVLSYFTTSLRNLLRQKTYLIINLAGLSVGIAAYMVIMLYVSHEKSYDRHLENGDRMFRVVEVQEEPGVGTQHVAITMGPLAKSLKTYFPQVKESARIAPAFNISSFKVGDKLLREKNMSYADPSALDMFSVKLIRGNPFMVLKQPNTVILSEDIAKKYFQSVDEAYNSIVTLDGKPFKVEGVMENQSKHGHLYFDVLISMLTLESNPEFEWMKHWGSNSFITYLLLNDKASAETINAAFPKYIKENIFSQNEGWEFLEMYLQPVNDVYLRSNHIKFQMTASLGDYTYVMIFSIVAILILLVACVNYINISLARSVKQAREVGMRKVLGADRLSLVYRFISESFVITLISILFSIGILELVLPEINKILDTDFILDFRDPLFNVGLVGLLLVISLISGSYPAFYLSKFQPVMVLKGGIQSNGKSATLSKVLVVFQFVISIGLIFSILMINNQLRYIAKKDLGINYDHSMFALFGRDDYKKADLLKHELMKNPAIKSVSASAFLNGVSGSQGPVFIDDTATTRLTVRFGFVDESFFDAMDIELIAGRNFDPTRKADSMGVVIFNESAMRALGWDTFEGKRLRFNPDGDSLVKPEVIGVIRDYHYFSLKSLIEPAAWFYSPSRFRGLSIKYAGQSDKKEIENFIEKTWNEILPQTPFESFPADEYLNDSYKSEIRTRSLFIYFAIISLFLSCLGLYGLTSLLIEQKTKIIGIRKVLGSPVFSIVFGLVKEYMILVSIAGVIAIPLSMMFITRFLEVYPYRVGISIPDIAIAVVSTVVVAFITIVFKASKTALSNPLEALKYE